MSIGKSTKIRGELSANEDLTINGEVDGLIDANSQVLTIGESGRITAQVFARVITIEGKVRGNLTATEKIEIRTNGSVEGDLVAPKLAIADGAQFRGKVDMTAAKHDAAQASGHAADAPKATLPA